MACGRLNEHGLKIESYWDGQEAVAVLEPRPYHIGIPGYVYGGLIASVIDCHCIGTASAAALQAEGRVVAVQMSEQMKPTSTTE